MSTEMRRMLEEHLRVLRKEAARIEALLRESTPRVKDAPTVDRRAASHHVDVIPDGRQAQNCVV